MAGDMPVAAAKHPNSCRTGVRLHGWRARCSLLLQQPCTGDCDNAGTAAVVDLQRSLALHRPSSCHTLPGISPHQHAKAIGTRHRPAARRSPRSHPAWQARLPSWQLGWACWWLHVWVRAAPQGPSQPSASDQPWSPEGRSLHRPSGYHPMLSNQFGSHGWRNRCCADHLAECCSKGRPPCSYRSARACQSSALCRAGHGLRPCSWPSGLQCQLSDHRLEQHPPCSCMLRLCTESTSEGSSDSVHKPPDPAEAGWDWETFVTLGVAWGKVWGVLGLARGLLHTRRTGSKLACRPLLHGCPHMHACWWGCSSTHCSTDV